MIVPTLGLAFTVLTLALVPLFTFLALVTASAVLGGRRSCPAPDADGGPPRRFLVVIPAYDEEANIAATVRSCLSLDYGRDAFSVLVLADNCNDGTARVARAAGAEVFERHDPKRRSKGYALEDLFRQRLETDADAPYDAVVLVDADTVVDPGLLNSFSAALAGGADWVQCYYTARNPDDTWRTRLMTYALSLFNGVWLLGQDRLGLCAGLRGNGMCFSTRGLARVPWRVHGLAEDLEFSWVLRVAGECVRFLPETRVYAEMVRRGNTAVSQRRRWEEGRKSLRGKFLRPVVNSPSLSRWRKALSLTELAFPPLMSLMGLLLLASLVHPAALAAPGLAPFSQAQAPLHAAMALTTLAYAVSPFVCLGLPLRYALALGCVPYYAAWKVVVTFGSHSRAWVRTQRESASGPA